MAITSQIKTELAIGEAILQDWQAAGLAKPSMLKPLIATLEHRLSEGWGNYQLLTEKG